MRPVSSEEAGRPARQQGSMPLAELAPGVPARIVSIGGGPGMRRRCLALGLRPGAEISVGQTRRRGVVVGADNTRVALGEGMAANLMVELREKNEL